MAGLGLGLGKYKVSVEYFGLGSKEVIKYDGNVKSQLQWTPAGQT